ncbi:putative anoctamin [Helianthus annuus]|nr:putative anoctamin [Helianthus annuus]KAJ0573695.1 putative anoctamin [Helianthus annuus]
MLRFRNDAIIILSIICLQLPFELTYAHWYEIIGSDMIKFGLMAIYLFAIQYFTQIGGEVLVKLIKREKNESSEYRANTLIYKVVVCISTLSTIDHIPCDSSANCST